MTPAILVLDDEEGVRRDLSRYLAREGYEIFTAKTIQEVNEIILSKRVDFAIIDLKIDYSSDYGGIKAIENINKSQPRAATIVLTAYERSKEVENQLEKVTYYGYVPKGGEINYILAVINTLRRLQESPPPKKCFVIMPFSSTKSCTEEQWLDIFENMIKPAVVDAGFNYECFRASLPIGNIISNILDNLNKADVVIADMTDRNPNVFYELGVRHALRNATILITQDLDCVPFDLRHYAAVRYEWTTRRGRDEFKGRIKDALSLIERDPNGSCAMSPIREYLKL